YVVFTSGSTGTPKGVLTTHANVTRVVKETNYIDLSERDTLLQLSNYAFDGSVFDIYGALLNGASLVLLKKEDVFTVEELSKMIKRQAVNVFFITTAYFNTLTELEIECFKNIRKVLFGGERVSVEHTAKALNYLGKNKIIHVYGPTETTVYATYYPVDELEGAPVTIPIGTPLANTTVYVLNKVLRPIAMGIPGELYIGADGLARGYLNDPGYTAKK
ncbi:MAG: AMP-binding protein, partial [bacterium]|nr:AMP-binding protein [bacterium]